MNIRALFAIAGFALAGSAIGSGEGPVPGHTDRECVKECRSTATFSTSEPVAGDGHVSVSDEMAHSEPAVRCSECHGRGGWFDWKALGYQGDPAKK